MVVAMIAMGMVQVTSDEIVNMVSMRYGLVPTAGSVHVIGTMGTAIVVWRAPVRVGLAYPNHMFINVITMQVVKVAVMQIVNMAIMQHGSVATVWSVLVGVIGRMGQ
ncbi:hypothetical protein [Cupriavidus sp. CuC1]|uniref:hypothetical protein n=1 Tax=Cupriavidus sp. CuC1 TaxID=3373131 RepID=UPI0037D12896